MRPLTIAAVALFSGQAWAGGYQYDPAAIAQDYTECAGLFEAVADYYDRSGRGAADFYYEAAEDTAWAAVEIAENDDGRNRGRFTDWAFALVDNHADYWRARIRQDGITYDAEHLLADCEDLTSY